MPRISPRSRVWRAVRLAGDAAIAAAAFYAAFQLRMRFPVPFTDHFLPPDRLALFQREWPVVVLTQPLALYFAGLHDAPQKLPRLELLRRVWLALAAQGGGLIAYYFFADREFPRSVLLLYVLLSLIVVFAWRALLQAVLRLEERRVVIVGSGRAAREIAESIATRHWHGLRVAGFVPVPGEEPLPAAQAAFLGPALGTFRDLPRLLAEGVAEDIVLAGAADTWQTQLLGMLSRSRPEHTNVLLVPGPFESLVGRMRYRWVHDIPLIDVMRESEWRINWPLKRLIDLAAGGALLLLALPLMAITALVIKLTSRGPVLYRQTRLGRGQRPFTLVKFRTMRTDAEAQGDELLAQQGDERLTGAGAWLRRYRLDELPQLWNVLNGTMSLVGPRPERPGFVQRYLREVPGYAERFSVAPGLTGLAQVNGDYHSSPENKLRYDLAYVANWSVWLDLSILLRTVKNVLTSSGV
jgi:exopolysaccharide biosynthesis polyprenyl glycosylphosphotransferase